MNLRNLYIYLLAFPLLTIPLKGQDPLTLSAALETALENNYGLIISRADMEVAQINNNWGTAGRYPTIGFDATDRINL